MTSLVVLLPVLRRPQRVRPVVESIRAATPQARILFICDPDDRPTQDQVALADAEMISPGGNYAAKINQGVEHSDESLIFFGADDLIFHPDWFAVATKRFRPGIGVVGTNDLGNKRTQRDHSTHPLVARWYATRGTIDRGRGPLHEGYHHNFCDDEFIGTAIHRRAYAHAADSIVEHLHPLWGKAENDEIYELGRKGWVHDKRLHRRRRRLWL